MLRRTALKLKFSLHFTRIPKYYFGTPKIAGYKSIKVKLEKGEDLWWCGCGCSQNQPYCDGSHTESGTGCQPIKFTASEARIYGFCTCKQSKKAPLCDGSHKELTKPEEK